ncbi:MAG: alpha/beta fold hydrolase [Moheibacter sp.]
MRTVTVRNYRLSDDNFYDFELSFQLFGRPLHTAPVVLVNHALTGNSGAAGPNGWWKELIGEGKTIGLENYTVIAFDVPGNGFGPDPVRLDLDYRLMTVKIIAGLYWKALDGLGIHRLFAAIGGSLGGSIAWEMAFQKPDLIENLIPVACSLKASDWLIGNVLVQDEILSHSENPIETARKHAMLLYRTPVSFDLKFNRKFKSEENQYAVESWLNYHGCALKNRFSLDAYKQMNHLLKTIGEDLTEDEILNFSKVSQSKIHLIAIETDYMFTKEEQKEIYRLIRRNKYNIGYHQISSVHGHDAFLIEYEQLSSILKEIFAAGIKTAEINKTRMAALYSA